MYSREEQLMNIIKQQQDECKALQDKLKQKIEVEGALMGRVAKLEQDVRVSGQAARDLQV